ncbi:nitroreductase [Xylanimonas cellulosilytica DSM 15894]|uniref:Nitroreductase n=1 Tax=Xylanimonas cellulosilytica (strain DSM 15894 / JCM 12276 / CECT 5975 / KCTC 9989 / LMG 20990 / NBRC 107835 / XIL07) TaxID=446471 RepID=D1BYN0_XYLCX|nr:nitroreductase family protein [Xylanimonas cellulosilytica]ACZ31902.1 nitroreductase [Xylanimonas cellulosilytica DSM 15894]
MTITVENRAIQGGGVIKSVARRLYAQQAMRPLMQRARLAVHRFLVFREFVGDAHEAARDTTVRPDYLFNVEHVERELVLRYHQVEKGLVLPEPRRPFGIESGLRQRLSDVLDLAATHHPRTSSEVIAGARTAVEALDEFNEFGTYDVRAANPGPGVKKLTDAEAFFASRRSCRDFDTKRRITVADIERAVGIAQTAPSACNRQSARVHLYSDSTQVAAILGFQGGATGFTDCITDLIAVTVKRGQFRDGFERNQRWVDGGIFAQTLTLGLHAIGYSSCFLNAMFTRRQMKAVRSVAGIPGTEDIVAFLAVGTARDGYRVAGSPRLDLRTVLTMHSPDGAK